MYNAVRDPIAALGGIKQKHMPHLLSSILFLTTVFSITTPTQTTSCLSSSIPTRVKIPQQKLRISQYIYLTRDMPRSTNKIKSPNPCPGDGPTSRVRYNRTMRAEGDSPKAYVQRPNQRGRIGWKTESSQPLSVYERPAFECWGGRSPCVHHRSRRPALSEVRWGGRREALGGSVLLMRLRKDKDRAE